MTVMNSNNTVLWITLEPCACILVMFHLSLFMTTVMLTCKLRTVVGNVVMLLSARVRPDLS
jgi:hypothetical protein